MKKKKTQGHFWIIFTNEGEGWEPRGTSRGGLDIQAYRSQNAARSDLYNLRQTLGRGRVRLYKFKPEAFILAIQRSGNL